MSEIKPWGYIHPEVEKILRDKAAYNTCITKKRAGHNTIPLYTASQLAEAVAAEREKNDALIGSLAVGYERMRGVLCKMAATSGPDTRWYRHQATQGMDSVPGIWGIAKIPVEAEPGECSWINRDGSLEAIRSAAK